LNLATNLPPCNAVFLSYFRSILTLAVFVPEFTPPDVPRVSQSEKRKKGRDDQKEEERSEPQGTAAVVKQFSKKAKKLDQFSIISDPNQLRSFYKMLEETSNDEVKNKKPYKHASKRPDSDKVWRMIRFVAPFKFDANYHFGICFSSVVFANPRARPRESRVPNFSLEIFFRNPCSYASQILSFISKILEGGGDISRFREENFASGSSLDTMAFSSEELESMSSSLSPRPQSVTPPLSLLPLLLPSAPPLPCLSTTTPPPVSPLSVTLAPSSSLAPLPLAKALPGKRKSHNNSVSGAVGNKRFRIEKLLLLELEDMPRASVVDESWKQTLEALQTSIPIRFKNKDQFCVRSSLENLLGASFSHFDHPAFQSPFVIMDDFKRAVWETTLPPVSSYGCKRLKWENGIGSRWSCLAQGSMYLVVVKGSSHCFAVDRRDGVNLIFDGARDCAVRFVDDATESIRHVWAYRQLLDINILCDIDGVYELCLRV
jgi:hypothetical protein